MDNILEVRNLSVGLKIGGEQRNVIDNVSFSLPRGKVLAIVGESGCGKTVTCLSLAKLMDSSITEYPSGTIHYIDKEKRTDILKLGNSELRNFRASKIGYIFQEPSSSLNPVYRIKDQIAEVFYLAGETDEKEIEARTTALLDMVGIADSRRRMHCYPHELSGGMQQRVMIAMALAGRPSILVADEPTTALDVTIQAQIIALIKDVQVMYGMSVIIVTHNLGLVGELADDVMVMYAGKVVEKACAEEIFDNPLHPYTRALIAVSPCLGKGRMRLQSIPGRIPEPGEYPAGCRFYPRCSFYEHGSALEATCARHSPDLIEKERNHYVACHGIKCKF